MHCVLPFEHFFRVHATNFNVVQLAIVDGLYKWRDQIARADDESTDYVLPNRTLLEIAKEMQINVGKLQRLLKSKIPYVERNIDGVVGVIRRSMQNTAAFESVVESLETLRLKTALDKNTETTIEETDTGSVASSSSLMNLESNTGGGGITTNMLGSQKVSLDVSKKPSSSFRALPLKRKFENENKENEEVRLSKLKPVYVSKPDEVITVSNHDDEEETSETGGDGVAEKHFSGVDAISMTPKPKTCGSYIVVLDGDDDSDSKDSGDDDSDNDLGTEDERVGRVSEKQRERFMSSSLKPRSIVLVTNLVLVQCIFPLHKCCFELTQIQ